MKKGKVVLGQQVVNAIIRHLATTPRVAYRYAQSALQNMKWPKNGDTEEGMQGYMDSIEAILEEMDPKNVPDDDSLRDIIEEHMEESSP